MKKITAILAFSLSACFPVCSAIAAEQVVEFTPRNGFSGESEGDGTLKLLFGKARPFHVESHGKEEDDGTFRLQQRVAFEGKRPEDRAWIISTVRPNRYSATLSDAAGPVTGSTAGSHLSLRYRIKGPLVMHQELELMPDGKTIDNVGTITLLGIPVGHLRETITRTAPAVTRRASVDKARLRTAPGVTGTP